MVLYPNKLPESERVCFGICKKRQPQLEELKIKNPVEVKVVLQPDGGIILVK